MRVKDYQAVTLHAQPPPLDLIAYEPLLETNKTLIYVTISPIMARRLTGTTTAWSDHISNSETNSFLMIRVDFPFFD
jgi:hypothetical protein